MNKVSHEQMQQIFAEVPNVIRKLAAQRDHYKELAESYEQREEIAKIAHIMHEKGINPEMTDGEIFDMLEKAASQNQLADIARAVDLVVPDMGQKLAQLSETTTGGGSNRFEASIMGGNG